MWLALDGDGPLYRQAYRALRGAILDGRLPPGERLPSSRVLAREVKLARNTVLQAYDQLVAEGYAESRRGAGTFVVGELPDTAARSARPPRPRALAASAPPPLSAYADRAVRHFARGVSWGRRRPAPRYDFRYGDPAYDDSPTPPGVACSRAARAARASATCRTATPAARPSCGKRSRPISRARAASRARPKTCWSSTARSRRSISLRAC